MQSGVGPVMAGPNLSTSQAQDIMNHEVVCITQHKYMNYTSKVVKLGILVLLRRIKCIIVYCLSTPLLLLFSFSSCWIGFLLGLVFVWFDDVVYNHVLPFSWFCSGTINNKNQASVIRST